MFAPVIADALLAGAAIEMTQWIEFEDRSKEMRRVREKATFRLEVGAVQPQVGADQRV